MCQKTIRDTLSPNIWFAKKEEEKGGDRGGHEGQSWCMFLKQTSNALIFELYLKPTLKK